MIPKMCEECPHLTWDEIRDHGYSQSWSECEHAFFNPADEDCPRHDEYLEKLAEEATDDE